jgi:hypothetical protein
MTRHLGVSVRRRAATTESRSTGCPVEQQCTPVTRRPANPHRGGSRPPLDSWSTTLSGRFHDRLRRPQGRLRPSRPPEERPTSRLCSTDESVTFPNHCRPDNALSFHGLLFPSKVLRGPPPRRPGRLIRSRGSRTRFGDTNVPAPHARPLGLPYEPSLLRFTDATSYTTIGIEQVSQESVRTRSRETCWVPPPEAPDRSRARQLDSPPAPHRPSWGL